MSLDRLRIGFIGAGNMGTALMGGLLRSGAARPENILASDPDAGRLEKLEKDLGIAVVSGNQAVYDAADVCFFCVKPAQVEGVLRELAESSGFPGTSRKIMVSIAAGVRISKMEAALYKDLPEEARQCLPIFRVMPNTPALVGAAKSVIAGNRYATEQDAEIATGVLRAAGRVLTLPEDLFDAATAVSGSGPAYVFYLAEAMILAAEKLGLSKESARRLVTSTIEGAGKLLAAGDTAPEVLRARVTSPGGTTHAAVTILEKRGVREAVVAAIEAAAQRSRELSGE